MIWLVFCYLCIKQFIFNFVTFYMRYYIIAGEASGDLHASNLIKGIKKEDEQAEVRGWGGDLM